METDDRDVLVIRRIRVAYDLRATSEQHEAAGRVHEVHHRFCPVYQSLKDAIDITTTLELVAPET